MAPSTRPEARPPQFRIAPVGTASSAIGTLTRGCRIIGLTKGQFSLLDLIEAVLYQTGPAHLLVSTWTAGTHDMETTGLLLRRGRALNMRLLVDRSFPTRRPKCCARAREILGDDAITLTNIHAKFAVVCNTEWAITIRSSMNLNRNRRFEQFDLDDDASIAAFFVRFANECRAANPSGIHARGEEVERGFNALHERRKPNQTQTIREGTIDQMIDRVVE